MAVFRRSWEGGPVSLTQLDVRPASGDVDLPPTYEEARRRAERIAPTTAPDVTEWMVDAVADNILLEYYVFSVARGASRFGVARDEPSSTAVIVAGAGDGWAPGVIVGYIRAVRIPNTGGGWVQVRDAVGRWLRQWLDFGGLLKNFNLEALGHIPQVFYLKKYPGVQNRIAAVDVLRPLQLLGGVFRGSWKIPGLLNEIRRMIVNPSAVFELRQLIPLPVNSFRLVINVDSPELREIMIRLRQPNGGILREIPVKLSGNRIYEIIGTLAGALPLRTIVEVEPQGVPASTIRMLAFSGSVYA